jgi:cell division septation protein DedD
VTNQTATPGPNSTMNNDNSRLKRAETRSTRAAAGASAPNAILGRNETSPSEPVTNQTAAPAPSEPPVQNGTGAERKGGRSSSWRTPRPRDPYPLRSRRKA